MPVGFPSWVNGAEQASLSVMDRGLAYGDGVFETIRVTPRPVLLELHLKRLSEGLKRLDIPVSLDNIKESFFQYLDRYSPGLIKLIVSRGCGGRGYAVPEVQQPQVIIQGFELPCYQPDWFETGVDLFQCTTPVTVNSVLQGIKHLNRLEQVLARREFSADEYQEGLMATEKGSIVEGTMSNLFLVKQGALITAGLDQVAVNGTMARYITDHCAGVMAIAVNYADTITAGDIITADEAFICNSVFGIWPVKSLMGNPVSVKKAGLVKSFQHKLQPLFS
ncbi:MAG: aminodeoxychorismate lyase [Gammaproteobacteria bacterium]|nr:MAG: aminodeoxychorismate lyase [Gammaproteobacteria bacterium]